MRVLVTGATGGLGTAVVHELRATHEVVAVSRGIRPTIDGIENRKVDIRDVEALLGALKGVDAVVHLAALHENRDAVDTLETNIRGTYVVLEAARKAGVERVVAASSIAATGCLDPSFVPDYLQIDEQHPCRPSSPYAASKMVGEIMCESYSRQHGMTTISLRISSVEPLEEWTSVPFEDAKSPVLWTWVHRLDVASAVAAALRARLKGSHVVNIAADDSCSTQPSAQLVARFLAGVTSGAVPGHEPRWAFFSNQRARELLGWSPERRFDAIYRAGGSGRA